MQKFRGFCEPPNFLLAKISDNKVSQPIMGISNSFSLKIHLLHNKRPFSTSGEMSQRDIMA